MKAIIKSSLIQYYFPPLLGHSSGRNSLNKLQQSSTSWGSIRKTNINDFLSDSENEDVLAAASQRSKTMHTSSKQSKMDGKDQTSRKRGRSNFSYSRSILI